MNLFHPSALAALLSSEFCLRLTQSLLHFLWQGLAIGLAVWVLDRLLCRASSQARYAASVGAMLAMVSCLPATFVALGYLNGDEQVASAARISASNLRVESNVGTTEAVFDGTNDASAAALRPIGDPQGNMAESAANRASTWNWQALHSIPAWLAPYATLGYLLGVAIMLGRLGLALRSGHQLRQSGTLLSDPAILSMAARQARGIGLKVVPAIAWCQRAAVPLVVGIFKPVILLPTAIASGLAPDQLEALLAHELAHLKRLDLLVNLVQRLAESLLFFHPAVWYVSRKISVERENCCDDRVLAAGWGRVEYADALVRMAEICAAVRGLAGLEGAALLAASGETPSQFKRRVLRLLNAQDHLRMGISRGWLLAAVGAALLGIVAVAFAANWRGAAEAGQPERTQPPAANSPAAADARPTGAAAETKTRYLRGQEALDRIDKVKPAWSEAQSSVEFGIALIGDKKRFHSGERVPLEMFVRNVGKEEVKVSLAADFLANVPEVKNAAGEEIPVEQIFLDGLVPVYRETLKAGEAFGFSHVGLGLGSNPTKSIWQPFVAEPKPGKYTLRHTQDIVVAPADEGEPSQRLIFTTGVVEFEVAEGAAGDRRPPAGDAKGTLQAAFLERREYLEKILPNEEGLIKSELLVAEQKRSKAQESLERAKRLAAKGFITPLQLEAEDVALKQAQVEVTKAQTKLEVLQKFTKAKTLQELDRKIVDAVEALLDRRVALHVTGRPLIFILDDLEKAHGVPVTIDLKEVRARGATTNAQVTIDVTDKPLKEVFKAVLTSAGLDFEVTVEGIRVPARPKREGGAPQEGAAKPAPFKPFECQIVDAVTGKPVTDVTVNFRYKTPATKDAPEETVSDFFYTNVNISRFWFQVPKDAIGRPELSIEWGASHPDYEPLSPKERIPLAHILADDPKSARDTFRTIKLQPKKTDAPPAPGKGSQARIRVKYDIPGAEDEGQIFVQHIGGRDIIGTRDDAQLKINPVKKGETIELTELDPGDYQVARHRTIRLEGLGMSRFLERQRFKLAAGETKSIDFTRPKGQPLAGTVIGLKEAGLGTAVVNVCSENAKDDRSIGDLEVTLFDSRLCAADGAFKTENLAPGKYTIVVEGYVPLTPEQRTQSGIITPRYVGTAKLTVPEKGEAPKIEVRLEDTQQRADAKEAASARLVIHYDLPGSEERDRFLVEGPEGSVGPERIGLLNVNYVKNRQKLAMLGLVPGDYRVSRYRTLMLEESFGLNRFLDGRQFKLAEREMRALDFKRINAREASGRILGLEGKGINKVLVNICSASAKNLQSLSRMETTIFDALLCNDDGTFKTEPLEPGNYTIVAEGYMPLTPFERVSTGTIDPRYIGVAKFTVPESGETPVVEVKLEKAEDGKRQGDGAAGPAQAWGDLTVQVVYDGPRPEPKKFENTRDVALFGREIPDQSLLVGDKGGLANVAVYVTSADVPVHPQERKRAERPVEMKIVDGQLVPRVVSLVVRQKLKLINDTPVHFNFRGVGQRNSGFNVLVAPRDSYLAEFATAERAPALITDGIHAWIQAFALPLEHPYGAASEADGIARLMNLPDGEWTFRFWHEKSGYLKSAESGQRDFKIKIKPGENRLKLRVSPEFTVKVDDSPQPPDAPPERPDETRGAAPEPDALVRKTIEQPGVAIIPDQNGRIVDVAVGAPATDDLLAQLARLPELKKLHIETTPQLTAKGFENLAAAPALESLGLYDITLPQGSLASLSRMANLKELSVNECGLRDADLIALESLTKLRSLSLRGNAITDAGLAHVVTLTQLEELDLGNSSSVGSQMQISDDGLYRLTALKKLKRLNLSSTRLPLGFSDQGLAVLPGFRDLEAVDLSGFGLSDAALGHIGRCAQLRSLGLHFGSFTDTGMADVGRLKRLERISVSSGDVTEAGLLHLGSLPKLEFAELRTDGVTDRVLEGLSRIPSLARLDLYANSRPGVSQSSPPFTGAGMAHFKDHPGLRTLWLTNLTIDAEMLAALKNLKQLGELTLMMPSLSDDEVRALQVALPKTRVSAAWGGHGIAPLQLDLDFKRQDR